MTPGSRSIPSARPPQGPIKRGFAHLLEVIDEIPVQGRPEAADVAEVGHLELDVGLAHVVDQMVLGLEVLIADSGKKKKTSSFEAGESFSHKRLEWVSQIIVFASMCLCCSCPHVCA